MCRQADITVSAPLIGEYRSAGRIRVVTDAYDTLQQIRVVVSEACDSLCVIRPGSLPLADVEPSVDLRVIRGVGAGNPVPELVIVDGRVAVVSTGSISGALFLDHPVVVSTLLARFEAMWSVGTSAAELSDQEHAALALLADGSTDEVAARRAGVSVRQLRRRIAGLMRHLGADSRFQAGVLAARRGWI